MAKVFIHYKCLACGTQRRPGHFGITAEGYDQDAPIHAAQVGVQTIGGDRNIQWDRRPLTIEDAQALLARYEAVVEQLRAEIAQAA